MPIIEQQSESLSELTVGTTLTASMSGSVTLGGTARASTSIVATLSGTLEISGTLDVETAILGVCNGFVPPQPDIFGEADISTSIDAELVHQVVASSQLQVATTIAAELTPSVSNPEVFECLITLDLLMPRLSGALEYATRLYVDGVLVPIVSYQIQIRKDGFTDLAIELDDVEQRSLITRDALIDFDLGWAEAPYETFTYERLLEDGYVNESAFAERPPDLGPDAFTFTALSSVRRRLNRTPATDLFIYNPNLVDVDPSDFPVIYDDFGRAFTTEILAIPDLTMEKLFEEIFENRCAFADFQTNLPVKKQSWPLSSVHFEGGVPYLAAINPRIGMFDPTLEEVGNTLWVRGAGLKYATGSPTPEIIEASESFDLQLSTDRLRVDVIEMIYNLWTYEYDYTSERQENSSFSTDNDGETVITTITRIIQEYYRESQPTLPIHEEPLYVQTIDLRGDGWAMENSIERFYYRGTNRIRRNKRVQVPVPTVTPPYTPLLQHAVTEDEPYIWKAVPSKPSQIYMQRRNLKVFGLVADDYANPRADGTPFREALIDSHRKANFNASTVITTGPIRSEDEVTSIINKDAVEIRVLKRDHCANLTDRSWTEQRVGDIGKSALVNDQRSMYLFEEENAERTLDFKFEMNIGELSPLEGIKLGHQKLEQFKQRPNRATDEIELDPQLRPGAIRQINKRDGTSAGIFEIGTVTHRGSENGHYTSFEAVQAA
jgi:hypothetical protein